mgnify:CR=1 FL=1
MKSNLILSSESRELLGRNISVMSKDGFVCITEVMEALNEKRKSMGLESRRLDHLLSINDICTVRNLTVQNHELKINKITDLKKYGMAYRRGKGEGQKWYVNPYFFVMVALELDPEIYAKVIIWLHDGFIEDRNAAGEAYIKMSSAVAMLVSDKSQLSDKISRVAKAINFIVFNKHESGIRNTATNNQLNDIVAVENVITGVIDGGFIDTYDKLIDYLGHEWKKKWSNPITCLKD